MIRGETSAFVEPALVLSVPAGLPGGSAADAPPLLWCPDFLPPHAADRLLADLLRDMPWEARSVNFGGRRVAVPRLVAWFGAEAYRYGGFTHPAVPLPAVLQELLPPLASGVSAALGRPVDFNSVLLNYYRDGRDSMSFHSDNEDQLGAEPVIASMSLGARRTFEFRARVPVQPDGLRTRRRRLRLELTHGSLLVMHGRSQDDWEHAIPKEDCSLPRINLTFRQTAALQPGHRGKRRS